MCGAINQDVYINNFSQLQECFVRVLGDAEKSAHSWLRVLRLGLGERGGGGGGVLE